LKLNEALKKFTSYQIKYAPLKGNEFIEDEVMRGNNSISGDNIPLLFHFKEALILSSYGEGMLS
jgi:hypothetical protein